MRCNCRCCREPIIDQIIADPLNGRAIIAANGFAFGEFMDMVVCPTCGNKRCPHASDHELACTNSNAPGQYGSFYGYGGRVNELGISSTNIIIRRQ